MDFYHESLQGPLKRIGAGFCGTVWAEASTLSARASAAAPAAIKREDGGSGRSLLNDTQIYQQLLGALQACPADIRSFRVPKWHAYIQNTDDRIWGHGRQLLSQFPAGYSPCNVLVTERIPPVPEAVRHFLVDRYCPPALRPTIKGDRNDDDCLIRPYIGRRWRGRGSSRLPSFSLRNYPLHIDQMEDLGLGIYEYATWVANALEPTPGVIAYTAASRLLLENNNALQAWVGFSTENIYPSSARIIDALTCHVQSPFLALYLSLQGVTAASTGTELATLARTYWEIEVLRENGDVGFPLTG
ncbi:Uu.00g009920.m01.CDS01 [Anthostomella pinea]|uniref:Uu.00g009920.m01.CDS01 n=1 Tax=Anthostomella pinea TaxID=933095 RepID=A0AAI8YPZ0_9PEZI|nr:Uu.00g009920.m01.CDS01 [Anthostomella pinea]